MLPCARDYMMEHGMAAEKYHVVPNGVDVAEWQGADTPLSAEHLAALAKLKADKRFLIGYAGGHGLANALDFLLEAAAQLQDTPVSFVLVGDGPDKAALVAKAAAMGLSNVHFLPSIPKRAVPAFLAEMDSLFIGWRKLPIYRFGINPNKLFDYLMAGKPVIHSVDAGNDMVKDAGPVSAWARKTRPPLPSRAPHAGHHAQRARPHGRSRTAICAGASRLSRAGATLYASRTAPGLMPCCICWENCCGWA
jgi:glycosyltransferase involved in cell wall biosynthesis